MPDRVPIDQITLTTPLREVAGVRVAHAEGLALMGVGTIADLMRHLPTRYERLEAETTIAELEADRLVSVRGEITATRISGFGAKQRFQAVLVDETGRLDLVWFNAPYMKKKLFPGLRVRAQGKSQRFGPGLQLVNPQADVIDDKKAGGEPEARSQGLRPIYPASEHVSSAQIEAIVRSVLGPATALIDDHLSPEYRKERSLLALADAYRMAHAPEGIEQAQEATRRLAYDELLLLQLGVFLRRAQIRATTRAPKLRWSEAVDAHIRSRFAFELTRAQDRVIQEMVVDLTSDGPGTRLIQGDVGSGKTVVALYAMLLAVASKQQAALMAPTELLAEQHFSSISKMLEGSNVRIALLTGGIGSAGRASVLEGLASGAIDLVIGTHAILTESVRFSNLAVAVIDEQHRFGVHQRATLRSKGAGADTTGASGHALPITPHVIVMTATPIPRTLALTLLGDLDISVIDELPPGRTPIATRVVPQEMSGEVYQYVRSRLDAGDQAYIVVPAIDSGASSAGLGAGPGTASGDAEINDLRTVHARLEAHELSGKRIAAVHGRLKPETRELVMGRFRAGQIDALIATTVIEVGVDVPNATVMVIEHAERFGLAQLHQLRGRVGRGSKKSACILIAEGSTPDAQARLAAIASSTDGFVLAETDLQIRGPGEVFGLRQAGAPPFRVADLVRDRALLELARRDASAWIDRSPRLEHAGELLLRRRLMKAHGQWLGIGDVA